jgi:DNA-directed RNA polymerase subunit L
VEEKVSKQHGQENLLKNCLNKSSHVEEESYEITKIFEGLGGFLGFFF